MLVNRELVRPPRKISAGFDLHLLGDCDDIVQHLCQRLGWELPPPSPPTEAPPLPPPTTVTTPLPPAIDPPAGGAKAEDGGSPQAPSPPPPTFVPPNSYMFYSSRVAGDAGPGDSGAAWAALSGGGGDAGRDGDSDNDVKDVVTW